jgi:hypothetical protein
MSAKRSGSTIQWTARHGRAPGTIAGGIADDDCEPAGILALKGQIFF